MELPLKVLGRITAVKNPNLIICPVCESKGKMQVLAEAHGTVIEILRFHNGKTRIYADSFKIECGMCESIVFYKENGTASY